jgi:D-sedoheptulose 7-phosphate isomerase
VGERRRTSPNLVAALDVAKTTGARIIGIVGRDGGYTASVADACVLVPTVSPERITHTPRRFGSWHLLVSHPVLKSHETKWESVR